jgi:hypothetical protein
MTLMWKWCLSMLWHVKAVEHSSRIKAYNCTVPCCVEACGAETRLVGTVAVRAAQS